MSNDTQWITRYLETEADRVFVDDMLREVELGIERVPLVMNHGDVRPRVFSMVVAIAAAVAMLAIGAAVLTRGSTPTRDNFSAAPQDATPGATDSMPATSTPTIVETSTTVVAVTQLPDGGLWLGGQVPMCQKVYDDQYDCMLTEPWPGDVPNYDDTGYLDVYLNSSSIIAGGCRAVSADAQHWFCYVGERAVEEGVLATYGGAKLGDWSPGGFIPG
jgi:hypothetical protein